MIRLLKRVWEDDAGAVVSTELVMVMGVGVFGAGAGVKALRDANVAVFERMGQTVRAMAPDPDKARALVEPPQPAAAASAVAVNQNYVVVHVHYPPPASYLPPAP